MQATSVVRGKVNRRLFAAFVMAAAWCCSVSSPAGAALYWAADFQRVDQDLNHTYSGVAPDNVWNVLKHSAAAANPVFNNLLDNSGAVTGVSLAFTGTIAGDHGFANVGGQPRANNPIGVDYFVWGVGAGALSNTTIGFQFSGLTPGASYEFTAYGGSAGPARAFDMRVDTNGDGNLNDELPLVVPNEADLGGAPGPLSHFPPSVTFTVTASAAGTILGDGTKITGNPEANWAGFQLTLIPEPSTATLALVGLLGLIPRARRTK